MFIIRMGQYSRIKRFIAILSVIIFPLYSAQSFALACMPDANSPYKQNSNVPTKTIKIYNNTDKKIYPLIETNTNSVDEWLQAYFGLCDSGVFSHTLNYRVYVNGLEGVNPGSFVSLEIPLYTKVTADADPVAGADKYINWWNGGRVKIYDDLTTYSNDYEKDKKSMITPASVGITCAKDKKSVCKDVSIYSGLGALRDDTPSQLTEYTFAGAPLKDGGNGLRIWAIQDVDWDVSYVDSVYLPIAMGVMGNKYIGYTGTVMSAGDFKSKMADFVKNDSPGYNWSHYIIPGDDSNNIIKLPGTYNYMRGVLNKTVTPPQKDSALNNIMILWKSCFQQGSPSPKYYDFDSLQENPKIVSCSGAMQSDMWRVQEFFLQNLKQYQDMSKDKKATGCDYDKLMKTLSDQNVPMNVEMLARIYGWVPYNDYCNNASAANALCKTSSDGGDPAIKDSNPNVCTKEYHAVHKIYRSLQYSYLSDQYPADSEHTFNPYVKLIHGKDFLNMHGYAFSIDDAVGNMQEAGNGLVIAVGGAKGLENRSPYNPKSAITITMGMPQAGRPVWKKFDACDMSVDQCIPKSVIPDGATGFKLGTIDRFPVKVVIQDSANRTYEFIIKQGPNQSNNFHIPADAVVSGSCKVTDGNNQPVAGWCAPFENPEIHGTPYAHTETDENGRPVNYISTNDPPP